MSEGSADAFDRLLAEAVREPSLLIPGTTLADGRYVVSSLIGAGGMGVVYRARDAHRHVEVAVKVLSQVDAAGIHRMKREFRSLSNLAHPNLVGLRELFCDRGRWFFTMDFVEGTPLSRVRWTVPRIRDVFGQVAGALRTIHQGGKLHRDLKPGNILVTPGGTAVVLDFGLVSDVEIGRKEQTLLEDSLSGTPAYMAPELALERATRESDWYAFGTMLFEALYGELPFPERGTGALLRKREGASVCPSNSRRRIAPDLHRLCMGLLERDPLRRPGDAEVLAVLGLPAHPPASAGGQDGDVFVGRDDELEVLRRALVETERRRSAVVTVVGAAGIGKTRLVERFLESVPHDGDGVILRGRCRAREHLPLRACDSVVDDLSHYLQNLPAERAASMLPRNVRALMETFPVLAGVEAVRAGRQRHGLPRNPTERKRLGVEALRELIGNIAARKRLVVFIDDMQWSDVDGARVLSSLVTRSDSPALFLVVAYRAQEAGRSPGLDTFLERLESAEDLHHRRVRVRGLGEAESRRLLVQLLPRDGHAVDAERHALDAGGNPLLIRQLARHLLESGADAEILGMDAVLRARIGRLRSADRGVLAATCLVARPIPLESLGEVTETADPEARVRSLVAAGLMRFVPGARNEVTYFHDRVREIVLEDLSPGIRRSLHARFVEALERTADRDHQALALHYLGCGRRRDAAASALQAARRAEAALAFEQAAGMYELAIEFGRWARPRRVELMVRMAETLSRDGRSADSARAFLRAANLAGGAPDRRALELRAAEQHLAGGRVREGIDLLRATLAECGLDYDRICSTNLVDLRTKLAQRGLSIEARSEDEIDPSDRERLTALQIAGDGLAWIRAESVPLHFALAMAALEAGDPVRLASALTTVARFDAQLDPHRNEVARTVEALCRRNPGARTEFIRAAKDMAMGLVRGRPWLQYAAARRAERALLRQPAPPARLLAETRFQQALALSHLGEFAELRDHATPWLLDAEDRNDLFLGRWLSILLALPHVAADRLDAARRMCGRADGISARPTKDRGSIIDFYSEGVLSVCDACEGEDAGWRRMKRIDRWCEESRMHLIPSGHCAHHYWRALQALASAQREPKGRSRREKLLLEAEASIRILARPRGSDGRGFVLPHYRNMGTLLGASLAALRGDPDSALGGLQRALGQLKAAGSYHLFVAHARRGIGLLRGGDEGASLVERAEVELHALGVRNPARHAITILPGLAS